MISYIEHDGEEEKSREVTITRECWTSTYKTALPADSTDFWECATADLVCRLYACSSSEDEESDISEEEEE